MNAEGLLLLLQLLATAAGLALGVITLWPKGEAFWKEINLYTRVRVLELRMDDHEGDLEAHGGEV